MGYEIFDELCKKRGVNASAEELRDFAKMIEIMQKRERGED